MIPKSLPSGLTTANWMFPICVHLRCQNSGSLESAGGYRFSERIMLHLDAAELSVVMAELGSVSDRSSSR
jgi:hypothetical protein